MSYAKFMASLNETSAASGVEVEVKKRTPDGSYIPADDRDFATADFDAELEAACCEIYNDWIDETIEQRSPRFRCAGLVPTGDVGTALAELERIKARGLAAAMLPMQAPVEYNDPQWEPLWDAIEDSGMPVVLHQGTGHDMIFYRGRGATVANLLATQSMAPRTAGLSSSALLSSSPSASSTTFLASNLPRMAKRAFDGRDTSSEMSPRSRISGNAATASSRVANRCHGSPARRTSTAPSLGLLRAGAASSSASASSESDDLSPTFRASYLPQ